MNLYEYYQKNSGNIILEGKSGYGKTYQLLYLAKQISDKEIPLYVDCTDISGTIWEYIAIKYGGRNASTESKLILDQLSDEQYRFCVLMDGLDKVSNERRDEVYSFINEIILSEKNRIVISINNYVNFITKNTDLSFEGFKQLSLKPYSIDKVKELLLNNGLEAPSFEYLETLQSPELLKMVLDEPELIKSTANRARLLTNYLRKKSILSNEKTEQDRALSNLNEHFLYKSALEGTRIIPDSLNEDNYLLLSKAKSCGVLRRYVDESTGVKKSYYQLTEYFKDFFFAKGLSLLLKSQRETVLSLLQRKFLSDDILAMIYSFCVDEQLNKIRLELDKQNSDNNIEPEEMRKKLKKVSQDKKEGLHYNILFQLLENLRGESGIKTMIAVRNILGVFMHHPKQLEDFDLSYLDLRATSFIGVNCQNVNFSNTQAVDECFVPIEPENANLFAISPTGNYYLTGNSERINLRFALLPYCAQSFFADNGKIFNKVEAISENKIGLTIENEVRIYRIRDNCIIQCTSMSAEEYNAIESNDINQEESFTNTETATALVKNFKAKVCCQTKSNLLLKRNKTYYLYNCGYEMEYQLVCKHQYREPIIIKNIVKNKDEIELLTKKDNQLSSFCYNIKTKKESRKIYEPINNKVIMVDGAVIRVPSYTNPLVIYKLYSEECILLVNTGIQSKEISRITHPYIDSAEKKIPLDNDTVWVEFYDDNLSNSNCNSPHREIGEKAENRTMLYPEIHGTIDKNDIYLELSDKEIIANGISVKIDDTRISFDNIIPVSSNSIIAAIPNDFLSSDQAVLLFNNDGLLINSISKDLIKEHMVINLRKNGFNVIDNPKFKNGYLIILGNKMFTSELRMICEFPLSFTSEYEEHLNITVDHLIEWLDHDFSNIIMAFNSGKYGHSSWWHHFWDFYSSLKYDDIIDYRTLSKNELSQMLTSFCYTTFDGIQYFDGDYSCHLKYKNWEIIRNKYLFSGRELLKSKTDYLVLKNTRFDLLKTQNSQHLIINTNCSQTENIVNHMTMYSYDLFLYKAIFENVEGLSGNTFDILKQYQAIPTYEIHPTHLDVVPEEEDSDKEKENLEEKKNKKKRHIFPSFRKKKTE